MRRGFTLLEILAAVMISAVMIAFVSGVFYSVSHGWEVSTQCIDRMQRGDYVLNQVVSALRSLYYTHDGQQSYDCGFQLTDGGDGEDEDSSDTIEWTKKGNALVGKDAAGTSLHRVQLKMCKEGERFGDVEIPKTGLYARVRPDIALQPKNSEDTSKDYSFGNEDYYSPVLVADGIEGFNCRVQPEKSQKTNDDGRNDESLFKDEFDKSNAVPYKVELTFHMVDPDSKSYTHHTAPIVRIVRLPMYEQSQDGAKLPGDEENDKKKTGGAGGAHK